MPHAVVIPKLGLTMEEATIVEWHYADGEKVARGTPLLTIETEKIASEVEAEQDGFLQQVAGRDTVLPVGAVAGYLHEQQGVAEAVSPAAPEAEPYVATPVPPPRPASLADGRGGRKLASPLARRIATARGIDLASLSGTGPGGVVLKRDVETAPAARHAAAEPVTDAGVAGRTEAARRPLGGMRRAISQRMMESLAASAQMTGFGKVDMTEAVRLRAALIASADALGARITFTDIVLKAAAAALREMPAINASIVGDEVVTWADINIGLAVALDDGLIVPVLRAVDRLSLVELSVLRQEMIDRARSRRLTREETEGGTFSLSNFGSYGGDFETPILNPPQSALLGIGRIAEEPAVRDGAIVARSMMMISLTFDHRLIDGAVAGAFRARLRALLEEPALLLATMR